MAVLNAEVEVPAPAPPPGGAPSPGNTTTTVIKLDATPALLAAVLAVVAGVGTVVLYVADVDAGVARTMLDAFFVLASAATGIRIGQSDGAKTAGTQIADQHS